MRSSKEGLPHKEGCPDWLLCLVRPLVLRYLYGFEEYCTSAGISFRMDLPHKLERRAELEAGSNAPVMPSKGAESKEQRPINESQTSETQSTVCKVSIPPPGDLWIRVTLPLDS